MLTPLPCIFLFPWAFLVPTLTERRRLARPSFPNPTAAYSPEHLYNGSEGPHHNTV
jgi:hypothetical protein